MLYDFSLLPLFIVYYYHNAAKLRKSCESFIFRSVLLPKFRTGSKGRAKNAVILHFKMIDCLSDTLFVVLLSIGFFYCFLFALILGVLISLCRFSLDSFFYRNRRRKLIYVNKTMPRIILGALSLAFLRNNHNFTSWL